MSHTVSVGEFEGPLGLLLELVEKGNMEVTAISVAHITTEYLERIKDIEQQSPENLSEFLQLGARLLYIKSLALLPGETAAERAEELQQLNLELEEYRRFQHLARELGRRANQRTWERRVTERLNPADVPLPNVNLTQLSAAFTDALSRVKPAPETGVIPKHISLEQVLDRLRHRLKTGDFNLNELLETCQNRLEIIVTFLALLELLREGTATVSQANQFEDIKVNTSPLA